MFILTLVIFLNLQNILMTTLNIQKISQLIENLSWNSLYCSLMQEHTIINKDYAKDSIKLSSIRIMMHDSQFVTVGVLYNSIIEALIALEPFILKVQSKLMLSKETATIYLTEYAKFILLCIKQPIKAYPSYTIELIWHIHFEFTAAYREFSNGFYGKFK